MLKVTATKKKNTLGFRVIINHVIPKMCPKKCVLFLMVISIPYIGTKKTKKAESLT